MDLERRALQGDRAAWNALIARHERRVLMTLLARGVRVDRAKDLVQDTWAKLIDQQREGKLLHLSLPGLAIKQAMFLAIDEARRKQDDVALDDAPELALVSDPSSLIEETLLSREELKRASDELDRCSPQAQQVFEMIYEDPALPHQAAAEKVGLSVQRLRQTLCEVRARLRAAIENRDPS